MCTKDCLRMKAASLGRRHSHSFSINPETRTNRYDVTNSRGNQPQPAFRRGKWGIYQAYPRQYPRNQTNSTRFQTLHFITFRLFMGCQGHFLSLLGNSWETEYLYYTLIFNFVKTTHRQYPQRSPCQPSAHMCIVLLLSFRQIFFHSVFHDLFYKRKR